jgi:hypothetical protein
VVAGLSHAATKATPPPVGLLFWPPSGVNPMPRTCTICRHPERPDIEADLRAGIPYRDIARRQSISKHALSRHRLNHITLHTATVLATSMKIKPLLDKAETAPIWNGTLLAMREARRCLEGLVMLLNSTERRPQVLTAYDRDLGGA